MQSFLLKLKRNFLKQKNIFNKIKYNLTVCILFMKPKSQVS